MKSIADIDRRLEEIKDKPRTFENEMFITYLEAAKVNYSEYWASHLLRKYSYEINENQAIVKALKWILEEDE